jgi:hypothetical protein
MLVLKYKRCQDEAQSVLLKESVSQRISYHLGELPVTGPVLRALHPSPNLIYIDTSDTTIIILQMRKLRQRAIFPAALYGRVRTETWKSGFWSMLLPTT